MSDPSHRVLLLGGTSESGLTIVRRLAADRPTRAYLLGRDRARLEQAAAGLDQAGCLNTVVDVLDADYIADHGEVMERAFAQAGGFEVVVLAVGVLGAQAGLDANPSEAFEVMRVNFVRSGSLLLCCLREMRQRGEGTLVVLSTVAVERPRASNAIYGAAKAGLDALAQAVADGIASSGVRVLVVRPGFVKTRMTAGRSPAPFATTSETVAEAIVGALAGRATRFGCPLGRA